MKRILIIAGLCVLLASCEKAGGSYTRPSVNPEDSLSLYHSCSQTELLHFEAVSPENDKWGNIEYWECPMCLKRYSDPGAKVEIAGFYNVPPISKTIIPLSLLDACDNKVCFYDEIEKTSTKVGNNSVAGIILSVCDLVTNLAFSIATPDVDNTTQALEEISAQMAEVDAALKEISLKEDAIIERLSNLTEVIESITTQQRCVEERHNDVVSLQNSVLPLYKTICQRYEMMKEPGADIDNQLRFMRADITSWAESTQGLMLTQSLLQSFSRPLATKVGSTFPDILANYTDYFCNWSNEGYNYRSQVLLEDRFYLSLGYAFSQAYYSQCKEWSSPEDRETHISATDIMFERYEVCYDNDIERRISDDEKYNIFICEGVRYYLQKGLYSLSVSDIHNWISNHLRQDQDHFYYYSGKMDDKIVSNNTKVWNDLFAACTGVFNDKVVKSNLFDMIFATRDSSSVSVEQFLDSKFSNRSSKKLFVVSSNRKYSGNGTCTPDKYGSATYGDVYHQEGWSVNDQRNMLYLGLLSRSGKNSQNLEQLCSGAVTYYGQYSGTSENQYSSRYYERLKTQHPSLCYIYLEKTGHI